MKFRTIHVNGQAYSWRVWGSADKVEVRGPNGLKRFLDFDDATGLPWKDRYKFEEFDRSHNHPFYVKYPITPSLIAAWLAAHEAEMSGPVKHPATQRTPRKLAQRRVMR